MLFGIVSLSAIVVEFLDDASCILDDLLIGLRLVDRERLYDAADTHLFESPPALFVDAKVANREQCNATRRLGGSLVMSDYFKQLLESTVPN